LRGGDVVATAKGTVFTLTVDGAGARVTVHEGRVDVRDGGAHREVAAGGAPPSEAAARLLALPAPPPEEVVDAAPTVAMDAPPILPSPADATRVMVSRDAAVDAATPDAQEPTPTERWRTVRLLRAQNKLGEAITECTRIADSGDATWAPIAILEAARIELGPRASPERSIEFADRLLRDWSNHTLAAEARELRCRALRQLGRECT
jgi:ferric-dicitrate binding protein FerR (iron transport regulator)